ncbi:MAG: pilus assembly protein [Comamonadaceae bacterium]|nr:MAG: pilus assembly protein [Comamonadaceae bacterium]
MTPARRCTAAGSTRQRTRGVAAIEFSFVAVAFFLLLYGLATFGAAFYTRQVISRAAEDGVRAALLFNSLVANDSRVRNVVYQSLASSLITPLDRSGTPADRLAWLRATVTDLDVSLATPGQVVVRVVYPYRAHPILPPIPLSQGWMPDRLTGRAVAPTPDA